MYILDSYTSEVHFLNVGLRIKPMGEQKGIEVMFRIFETSKHIESLKYTT